MVEQKTETTDFGILLGLAYQSFTDLLRASLAREGFDDLGGAYGYVFRAMAQILAGMVRRGYVERHADRRDSRVKRLRLGPRGRAALTAARRFHAAFERQLVKEVGAPAIRRFRQQLERIAGRGADDDLARARLRPT